MALRAQAPFHSLLTDEVVEAATKKVCSICGEDKNHDFCPGRDRSSGGCVMHDYVLDPNALLAAIEGERKCERCNGTGRELEDQFYALPRYRPVCPTCNGKGIVRADRLVLVGPDQVIVDKRWAESELEKRLSTLRSEARAEMLAQMVAVVRSNHPAYMLEKGGWTVDDLADFLEREFGKDDER